MLVHFSALLLLVASSGTPASPAPPHPALTSASAAAAQELPLRYAGDGLEVIVTKLNQKTLTASGTVRRQGEAALPFTLQLSVGADGLEKGKGTVQGQRLTRSLRTSENADGSIKVTYRAKRYTVTVQSGEGRPEPKPKAKSTPRSSPAPTGMIRLQKHTFHDEKVNGIASHTVLMPKGWSVEGGAFWLPSVYFQVMPSQDILVKSPEGVSVRVEPTFIAKDIIPPPNSGMPRPKEGLADGGFPILHMPTDLNDWKKALRDKVLPEAHPKAKNVKVTDAIVLEDLTKQLHQGLAQQKATAVQNNQLNHQMGMNEFVDGWVMGFDITFTEGGQEFEQARLIAITCMGTDSQMIGRNLMWNQTRALTFTAPKGRLQAELPLLLTVLNSLQETGPWMENRARLYAEIMKISHKVAIDNIRAAGERSRIMASAYDEVNKRSMDGYRSRSESTERGQESFINAINETAYYSAPGSSSRVQLPSGYDHVYSNGSDEYLLTNDALFNPAADLSEGNWTAMKPSQR